MIGGKKIVAFFSIAIGILLSVLSFCSIGFYIYTALQVWGKPDTSLLFWYSPFLMFSFILFLISAYFIGIGIQLFRGKANFYKINKFSLMIFLIILAVIIGNLTIARSRLKKQDETQLQLERNRYETVQSMHKIKSVDIKTNTSGLDFSIPTTEGTAGEYDLQISITYMGRVIFDTVEKIHLNTQEETLSKLISYDDLFKKCFTDKSFSFEYICVNNAGTSSSMFGVSVSIVFANSEQSLPDKSLIPQDTKELFFTADTMTKNGKVVLQNIHKVVQ